MRESQNKYEELISFCSDYSKEIENQNFFQPEAEENNADMFQQNQQRHQFGAISFYTTPQQQQQQYGTILPVATSPHNGNMSTLPHNGNISTPQPNRIMTNGSLPRDKNGWKISSSLSENLTSMGAYSNPAGGGGGPPSRGPPTGGLGGPTIGPGAGPGATQMPPTAGDVTVVVQSPRTKIRTTCTTILNPPTVSSRKPILFPNSGQNPQIYQYYHLGDILPEKYELKEENFEYRSQMLLLSSLKRQLENLESKEMEEKSEEELEKSLLNAEFEHISSNLADLRSRLVELRSQYARNLNGKIETTASETKRKLRESDAKMIFIKSCLERLQNSDSDPQRIMKHKEQLDLEKKHYDDLEFQLMEEESLNEANREELLSDIRMLEKDIKLHEEKLCEIDLIQTKMLSTEYKTSQENELLKKSLNRSIEEESVKLLEIYSTTLEVVSASSSEADFAETNAQRLHLLKRTQHELDQIYSTTESIMSTPSTRLSSTTARDSQHLLFMASTEPTMRNSVMISVGGNEENDSGVHDTLSKNDSLLSSSQQNDSAYPYEDSSEDSTDRSIYAPVKLRHPKTSQADQRPLTRYLPNKSQNFDLKHHIESSGHQIDVCSHIQINPTCCKGYLNKWTCGKLRNAWHKRWFTFDRDTRQFSYFPNSNQKEGTHIPFQEIEHVYVDHSWKSTAKKWIFCVKTVNKSFTLCAPTAETMRIWVDVIFTGADGHTEAYGLVGECK